MTVSEVISNFITATQYGDLRPSQVMAAKHAISDCLGCMIAGASTPTSAMVRRVAQASSAPGRASVIGSEAGLCAQGAALANGTAAHALDYDDILWTQYGHPSATVLSAAMAVGETLGSSGQDVILAFAMGVQVNGKLGRIVNPGLYAHGWHATAAVGVLGATAAVAKLMRLSPTQTAMALGNAASQACGLRRNFGTMTKPFHAGNAARSAVMASELAREGFTSDLTAIEGDFGWAKTMNARAVPQARELASALDASWELDDPGIVLKRYPACGATHCALDALLALVRENSLDSSEIEKVICYSSPFAQTVLLYPRPRTGLEGKFSMEFSLAVAAVAGRAGLEEYDDQWVNDPRVLAMLQQVTVLPRADLEPDNSADAVPAEVQVHARATVFTRKVMVPSGDPRNPMTTPQRREKFAGCLGKTYSPEAAGALFEKLEALDELQSLVGLIPRSIPELSVGRRIATETRP